MSEQARMGLRSTGLVVFSGRVISAFTGLLFTVMAAHWLVPSQLGTWEVIIDLVTFSSYPIGTVAYWVTRDVARGRMVGRTALAMGGILSLVGIGIYFAFMVYTYNSLAQSVAPFLLGVLLVPLSYWSGIANSTVQGHRPGVYGYSLVISEVAKLIVAYETLYVFHLAIEGVILALMASYLVQSVFSTYMVRVTASEPIDLAQAKRWSKLFWLPAISYLPSIIGISDTYVASLAFGTTVTGYYQVAFIVSSVVGYSSALAFSLYPILLRGGAAKLTSLTMDFALLFSIPMAAGGVALASQVLFLFRSTYVTGAFGLQILAVTFVFVTISGIIDQTLMGTEKVDEREKVSFWALARSNLLFVPAVNIAASVTYIVAMYLGLWYAFSHGYSFSTAVGVWGVTQLAATTFFMVVKAKRASRITRVFPSRSSVYYTVSAAAMGAVVYFLAGPLADQSLTTFAYGLRLLVIVAAGAAVYFGLVYLLDREFRALARSFLRMF